MEEGYWVQAGTRHGVLGANSAQHHSFLHAGKSSPVADIKVVRSETDGSPGVTVCLDLQSASEGETDFTQFGMFSFWLFYESRAIMSPKALPSYRGSKLRPGVYVTGGGFPFDNVWQGPWKSLILGIDRQFIADSLPQTCRLDIIDDAWAYRFPGTEQQVAFAMRAIQEDFRLRSPSGSLFREGIARALVHHFFERYQRTATKVAATEKGLSARSLCQVRDFIEANLDQRLTLAMLAAEVGISTSHFCTLFKQSTGMAPYRYVLEQRIESARRQLSQPKKPSIAELAFSLGFCDQSQFTAMFHKMVGMTPKQYANRT